MPEFVEPQLATLVDQVPRGDEWLHEVKFDGYRAECLVQGHRTRLLTRRGHDWTARFPAVAEAAAGLTVRGAVLDGEIVALLEDGRSSFQELQRRLGTDPPGATAYYAFDLLSLDGKDLRRLPLLERKQLLRRLLGNGGKGSRASIRYSDHTRGGDPDRVLSEACRLKLEGVVSKRADAPYESGRSRTWLKTKCLNRQEFLIVGFTEPKGSRVGVGALLLGVRANGSEVRFAGKVGTGMGTEMLGSLRDRLVRLRRSTSPLADTRGIPRSGVHWVEPTVVAEVSFTEWTDDGRLRHPAFVGLREDKSPREVRREEPMTVAGILLTNSDRVLYPDQGLTKRDLAAYYEAIAPRMLPHVVGRPLSLVRCPEGQQKACFFQKHWGSQLPPAVETVDIREGSGQKRPYAVVRDVAGVVSLVQYGVLEFHLWGSRADKVEAPDRVIFDLDPGPGVTWTRVQEGARKLRTLLRGIGLESWLKTSGGKGLHIVVPITRRSSWEEVAAFARAVAYHLAEREPARYLAVASKAARKGKIFVDWLRNTRGATAIAPWSTRAREGAPLSVPVGWEQLDKVTGGDQYRVANAPALLGARWKDPWASMLDSKQRLTKVMTASLET